MKFTDNFSRYPTSPVPKPLESNNNYVIILIISLRHILSNAQRILSNRNATKAWANNNAIKHREQGKTNTHAFSLNCLRNQSTSYRSHFLPKLHTNVLVCTRINPNSNKFDEVIKKRFHSKEKADLFKKNPN